MVKQRGGIAKVIIVVALAALVSAAFLLMNQEQKARTAAEGANTELIKALDEAQDGNTSTPTPERVHDLIKRKPHVTRAPGRHRYVEEYYWKGPMGQQTVYAYYSTAAEKFLEAVSLNQKLDDWEGDDK